MTSTAPRGAGPDTGFAERWFPLVARVFAVALLVFFGVAMVMSVTGMTIDALEPLIRWGEGGARAYEVMIETIYIVWALFLWRAASDPSSHRLFLDFTVVGNIAHFGVMAVEAFVLDGEHQHLYGDVGLGIIGLVPFTVFWVLARRVSSGG